jgi:hypothetical protein
MLNAKVFHPVELWHEWATRRNRPGKAPLDVRRLLAAWTDADRGEAPLHEFPALGRPPALMAVVMTYDRPEACAEVLRRLGSAIAARGLREASVLLVIHDACGRDYSRARAEARAAAGAVVWLDAQQRLGKANFWRSYQAALLAARAWAPERALFLHDDVVFEADLLEQADAIWHATAADPLRRVLYLFSSARDEADGRWVRFGRRDCPGAHCRLTNWFDLQAFMVDRAFFELLDHRMVPIHPNRWRRKPTLSSGVGRQLTLRLWRRGTISQAWPPLVSHGAEPSIANREARQSDDFDNREEYARAVAQRLPGRGGSPT